MKLIFSFMMGSLSAKRGLLAVFMLWSVLLCSQECDSSLTCCCGQGSDMNPSGIMIGHTHSRGKWMLSYRYMNMFQDGNLAGSSRVNDDVIFNNYLMAPQSMNMDMHMLMVMYGISDRLSVMAMANYNIQTMNMSMLPTTAMNMPGMSMSDMSNGPMKTKTAGFSDTRLYAMYSLVNKSFHKVILSAGLNLPTGSIRLNGNSKDEMYNGLRLPYMMQLGSGTYDLLPGATYLYTADKWLIGVQASGVIRPGYNALDYCYGNSGSASAWFAYKFLPWLSASVRAEGTASDRIYGRDKAIYQVMEPDAAPQNYGGRMVNAYGGLNFYFKKLSDSRLSIEYGMPVYQNLNGPQLATRTMLYAGWTVTF